MVDGKTRAGPWACMCMLCHLWYGMGYGIGRGQLYQKNVKGEWERVKVGKISNN